MVMEFLLLFLLLLLLLLWFDNTVFDITWYTEDIIFVVYSQANNYRHTYRRTRFARQNHTHWEFLFRR
jgi:hypothetical protein